MMTNSQTIKTIDILIGDTAVGSITLMPGERTYFEFSESYIRNQNRPTLSLNFKTKTGIQTNIQASRQRLHPFFSNLLPEGKLRDYLSNKLGVNPRREFFLLAGLGSDLPGAAIAVPRGDFETLRNEASEDEISEEPYEDIDIVTPMRFSLAGIQLKFSAIESASGGLTIPVTGDGGSWIIKLPSLRHDNLPETEYSMLLLAQRMGIKIPEFRLLRTNEIEGIPSDIDESFGESLAIKRFDRPDGQKRTHIEDFAQVFGLRSNDKYNRASYDNIAEVLAFETEQEDFVEYIRRLVFMIATGNGDMHVKNWSLIYPDGIKPRLSPAYDFIPTIVYNPQDRLGLTLGGTKSFNNVDITNFLKLASRARMPESLVKSEVKKAIDEFDAVWRTTKFDLPLPKDYVRIIDKHIQNTKLIKGDVTIAGFEEIHDYRFRSLQGDIGLDESVPHEKIRFQIGKAKIDLEAPPVMSEWAVGERAIAAANKVGAKGSAQVNVFVGKELFDQWRRNNYIVIDSKSLVSKVSPRDLDSESLEFQGLFMPNTWKKLIDTEKNRSDYIFDLVFQNGSAWTWKGHVLDVLQQDRLLDGRTNATLRIRINNPQMLYGSRIATPKIETRKIINLVYAQEDAILQNLSDFIFRKYTEGDQSNLVIGFTSHSFLPMRIWKAEVFDEEHIEIRVDFVTNASIDIELLENYSASNSFVISPDIPEKFFMSFDVVFDSKMNIGKTLRTRTIEPIYECRLSIKKFDKRWEIKTDSFRNHPDLEFKTTIDSEARMKAFLSDLYIENEKSILHNSENQVIQLTNTPYSSLQKWELFI